MLKNLFSNETVFPWIIKIKTVPISIEFLASTFLKHVNLLPCKQRFFCSNPEDKLFLLNSNEKANPCFLYHTRAANYLLPKSEYSMDNSKIKKILNLVDQYFYFHLTNPNSPELVKEQLTSFQFSVLTKVATLPFGCFETYGKTAEDLGNPNKARAVGNALGANPLPLVIPCHRIISKSGIGGYSPGQAIKQWLLQFEGFPEKYLI